MKNYLFILCGEAFSGKSTLSKVLAEKYGAKIVGRDTVYFALEEPLALKITLDEDDDALWKNLWPIAVQGTKNQLLKGNSVVFDDNCFYLKQREELRMIAKELNIRLILIYLDIPLEILQKRKADNKISKHRHDIPSEWLAEDRSNFERPTEEENPIVITEDTSFESFLEKINVAIN